MKVLSLFAGIGGFDLGLQRAGFEIPTQVEIDPFCLKILEKHWPEAERFGDIRELEDFPKADLICAGFPCQDISVAGRGAGLSGNRSGLWTEALRAVRMVRPSYVLLENVAALRNRGLSAILGALAESGYDAEWDCLSASAFGAPHQRDRLFIVAYPHSNELRLQHRRGGGPSGQGEAQPGNDGQEETLANSEDLGREWARLSRNWRPRSENCSSLAYSLQQGLEIRKEETVLSGFRPVERSDWWNSEPSMGRVADGVPSRVDRIKALGNAVVPQIPEWIGRQIMEVESRFLRH